MSNLTFLELAEKVLREGQKPMSPEEIWDYSVRKHYTDLVNSSGKTPWRTIGAQLYVDIRDNPESLFVKYQKKPTKFFLKKFSQTFSSKSASDLTQETPTYNYCERSLHPFLSYFAYNFMLIYTKTIFHEKSSKKSFSQWLHPDLVGVYFPVGEWQEELLDLSKEIGTSPIKLYSFELKKELNFQNLRESFFQAVSNSSWANEGYLVTAVIDKSEEFTFELKRLSTSFGIGIIKLDIFDPDSSEILFPAKLKSDLDWDNMNKLAEENPDFRYFLKRIKVDLSSKEIIKERYDKILSTEKLISLIAQTK